MKFRIEKGTTVFCRNRRGKWSIGRWTNMLTEKTVEFDVEDIWFAPLGTPLEKTCRAADGEPKDFRERIDNKYYLINYYGFHLPKNKFNVEQIVIPKNLVTVIEDVAHISEARRLQRKVHRARRGQYSFTGIQNR